MGYRLFEVKLTKYPKSTCRRGASAYLWATINGKPLGTSGVKWSVVRSGVHKWHKATNSSGQIGYFTSSKKGKGTLKYERTGGDDCLSINSKGKVTVAKKTAKGVYTMNVKVTAAGTANYDGGYNDITVTVNVE